MRERRKGICVLTGRRERRERCTAVCASVVCVLGVWSDQGTENPLAMGSTRRVNLGRNTRSAGDGGPAQAALRAARPIRNIHVRPPCCTRPRNRHPRPLMATVHRAVLSAQITEVAARKARRLWATNFEENLCNRHGALRGLRIQWEQPAGGGHGGSGLAQRPGNFVGKGSSRTAEEDLFVLPPPNGSLPELSTPAPPVI